MTVIDGEILYDSGGKPQKFTICVKVGGALLK